MLALKEFPEIEQIAGAMLAPYQFGSSNSRHQWRGRDIEFGVAEVTDGFKDVMGLQVVEGRWFNREDDGQTYEPVVINADMRRDLFGDGPAIGENIANDRLARLSRGRDATPDRRRGRGLPRGRRVRRRAELRAVPQDNGGRGRRHSPS